MDKERLDRFTFEKGDIEKVTYKELQERYAKLRKEIGEKGDNGNRSSHGK